MSTSGQGRKVAELKLQSGAASDGGTASATAFDIHEGVNTIGGSPSDDIILDGLVPNHALIEVSGGEHFIEARKVSSVRLNNCVLRAAPRMYQVLDGNTITLGDVVLVYSVVQPAKTPVDRLSSDAVTLEAIDVGQSLDVSLSATSSRVEEPATASVDDSAEVLASPTFPLERVHTATETDAEHVSRDGAEFEKHLCEGAVNLLSKDEVASSRVDVVEDSQDAIISPRRRKHIIQEEEAEAAVLGVKVQNDAEIPAAAAAEPRDMSPDIFEDDEMSECVSRPEDSSVDNTTESVQKSDVLALPKSPGHGNANPDGATSDGLQEAVGNTARLQRKGRQPGAKSTKRKARANTEWDVSEVLDAQSGQDANQLVHLNSAAKKSAKPPKAPKGAAETEKLGRKLPARGRGVPETQNHRWKPLGSKEEDNVEEWKSSEKVTPPLPVARIHGKLGARAAVAKRRKVGGQEVETSEVNAVTDQDAVPAFPPASRHPNKCAEATAGVPKITTTGISASKIAKTVKELGWTTVDSWRECTHLVTDKVRRTVKFLCATSSGKPIVTTKWLETCKTEKGMVDPEPFIVQDKDAEKQWNFSLKETLTKVRADGDKKVFSGVKIYATPSTEPRNEIKELVEAVGAEFLKKPPSKPADRVVVLGSTLDEEECYKLLSAGFDVVSNEYILQGILRHRRDLEPYRISLGDLRKPAAAGGRRKH